MESTWYTKIYISYIYNIYKNFLKNYIYAYIYLKQKVLCVCVLPVSGENMFSPPNHSSPVYIHNTHTCFYIYSVIYIVGSINI